MTNHTFLVKGMKLVAFLGLLIGIFNFFMMQVFVDNISNWLRWGYFFNYEHFSTYIANSLISGYVSSPF